MLGVVVLLLMKIVLGVVSFVSVVGVWFVMSCRFGMLSVLWLCLMKC